MTPGGCARHNFCSGPDDPASGQLCGNTREVWPPTIQARKEEDAASAQQLCPWLSRTRTAHIPATEQLALQPSHLLADHSRHNLPVLLLLCSPPWGAGTRGSTSGGRWGRVNRKVLLGAQGRSGRGGSRAGSRRRPLLSRPPLCASRTSEGTVGSCSTWESFPLGSVLYLFNSYTLPV